MRYAENTTVPIDKSKAEIERTLMRYGATKFMYGWDDKQAIISFSMVGRMIRFQLAMPRQDDFATTETGRARKKNTIYDAWEKACRQRWRALALVIKAKLEACESGISEFEQEFLAHIVLPDNSTVGEYMAPQIELAYQNKKMPNFLPWN